VSRCSRRCRKRDERNACPDVCGFRSSRATLTEGISFDCNGTPAQQWELNLSETEVRLTNTNFCLDAGDGTLFPPWKRLGDTHDSFLAPANGTPMKIWDCFSGIPAQTWFFTTDERIALENQGILQGTHLESFGY
jgi:hypothetical protein